MSHCRHGDEFPSRATPPTERASRLSNVKITVGGGTLAYVRADFQVVRDGKVVSRGVDQFTLVRDGGGWKLVAIAYTSMLVR